MVIQMNIKKAFFEGWYFKHQSDNSTIAFIPGRAESGAFVQVISDKESRQFPVKEFSADCNVIRAGQCIFSSQGCWIDLPGISGDIRYGRFTPLCSDIMGPFRFLPLECSHGVISMSHKLTGAIVMDGEYLCFDNGRGYIERDRGTSFPKSYLWLQCNAFSQPGSIMVSIAEIPFAGIHFTGCICAIVFEKKEYRIATYCGVKIHAYSPQHVCLSQKNLLLDIEINTSEKGHPLASPVDGKMSGIIRESHQAAIRCRLWNVGQLVMDFKSNHASFEFVANQE